MENFTLNKLWDLRGELDNSIVSNDYDRIKEIKVKYENLVDRAFLYNRAFICYNFAFQTIGDRQVHNAQNVISILKNIEDYERKYVYGEDVSIKLKTPHSNGFLAEEIWVLRAMYDEFLLQNLSQSDEQQTQQNMILGRAIIDKLKDLKFMRQTPQEYYEQIVLIEEDVRVSYETRYGKNKPKLNYYNLSDAYLERQRG